MLTAATISWTAGAWIQARWRDAAGRPHRFVRAGFASRSSGWPGCSWSSTPDVPWPIAVVPAFGARRPRDGPRLLAAGAHRPARVAAGDPGRGHERAVADRFARDGARDRASTGAIVAASRRGSVDDPAGAVWPAVFVLARR